MESYEEYYKLGVRYANKLINATYSENSFLALKRLNENEIRRRKINEWLVSREYYYFTFNILTLLIGLNKENIEKIGTNSDYEYDLSKNGRSFNGDYHFISNSINKGKYDEWLRVIKCSSTSDYIFNVRNGILHSEFEPYSTVSNTYNIRNSNYTNFEAEIYLPAFFDFVIFYFGNSHMIGKTSLQPQIESIATETRDKINNCNELESFLDKAKMGVINQSHNTNKKDIDKTTEYKISKSTDKNGTIRGLDRLYVDRDLTPYEQRVISSFINNRIPQFYSFDFHRQLRYIGTIDSFIFNPNYSISTWVLLFWSVCGSFSPNNFDKNTSLMCFGTGFEKIAAIFAKLGFVLYRMQYKKFEEIDYNLVNLDISKINYKESGSINDVSPYAHAFNKIKLKNKNFTNNEIRMYIMCEIIRNSISHGKIDAVIDPNSGDIRVIFVDKYKGKQREISLSIDNLKDFVMSEAFEPSKCIIKEKSDGNHK